MRILKASVVSVIAIVVVVLAVLAYQHQTTFLQPATCLSDHCFCEEPRPTGLAQPVDAITSFAFVLLGAWGLFGRPKKATKEQKLIISFAAILLFIGVSSFFYHSTLSFLGQFLDIFSMYLFGTLLILGALIRRGQLTFKRAVLIFVIANIILGLIQYSYPDARRVLFALILLPGIALEFLPRTTGLRHGDKKMRFLYIGAGSLVVAYAFWLLDQANILCWGTSLFQGHGVWHVLTAVAAYMIILHYRQTPHAIKKP